ncbi:uncharacterized protein BYT42DRAFT_582945 [Radiomyces spectabilis]|uniref:uncharacterized protein n=1 Tax=Radiomyces spectabilis TaxID=64574 RepID=UPI00221E40A1|nr:uncharacterized protein BYT42DRAFT_582945 [Radiomyces spectabilis]KAI8370585.1 hypothetical protein BYT42DRAFT_582945 [Radiomyces spectabilis]
MPLFQFRKTKKSGEPGGSTDLKLRRTKSTGNIKNPITMQVTPATEPPLTTAESDSASVSSSGSNSQDGFLHVPTISTSTPLNKSCSEPTTPHDDSLMSRLNSLGTNDLELLLSLETQARLDALDERNRMAAAAASESLAAPPRPTRLKFELPVTPPRSRSPAQHLAYPRARPYRSLPEQGTPVPMVKKEKPRPRPRSSRWSRLVRGDNHGNHVTSHQQELTLNAKVKLVRRPLPTLGHIRYIGNVDFAPGKEMFGVELISRVGNNDGSVNGKRYFKTDPHRGIFVTREELALV